MAQTPTAFDTIRNRRNGDHARRPSPPGDLEDSDDALAGNVQSGATATVLLKNACNASIHFKARFLKRKCENWH